MTPVSISPNNTGIKPRSALTLFALALAACAAVPGKASAAAPRPNIVWIFVEDMNDWMEGRDVFAPDHEARDHVISARDRCDYTIDRVRAVTTRRYKYLRNFLTDRPFMQPQYRDGRDYVEVPRELYKAGKLTAVQSFMWSPTRVSEELYDLESDPHETKNLANHPAHAAELARHRKLFESRGPKIPADMDNELDYNLFINPTTVAPFELTSWRQKTGFDQHSQVAVATLDFSPRDWTLRGVFPTLECPRLGPVARDYIGVPRSGATTDSGPFLKLNLKPELLLLPKRAGNEKRPRNSPSPSPVFGTCDHVAVDSELLGRATSSARLHPRGRHRPTHRDRA